MLRPFEIKMNEMFRVEIFVKLSISAMASRTHKINFCYIFGLYDTTQPKT